MSIRVGMVEDDRSVRENLAVLINAAPGFTCVAACRSGEEALKVLPGFEPHVVLMDIHLPALSGTECVARLKTMLVQTQFIMLTVEEDSDQVFDSLKAGASGYLVKHVPPETILRAVAEVVRHIYEKLHVRSRAEAVAKHIGH